MQAEGSMVFGFINKHRVGTVCMHPCEQCAGTGDEFVGLEGKIVPRVPFYIRAEVSEEDWRQFVLNLGVLDPGVIPQKPAGIRFFYEVITD